MKHNKEIKGFIGNCDKCHHPITDRHIFIRKGSYTPRLNCLDSKDFKMGKIYHY